MKFKFNYRTDYFQRKPFECSFIYTNSKYFKIKIWKILLLPLEKEEKYILRETYMLLP